MLLFTLQPSTIDLIAERMKRDGYSSPDILVREALDSLKPKAIEENLELDFSYEPVPLQEARSVDTVFVKVGELEMVPFGGKF
jgi:hypothetical protein